MAVRKGLGRGLDSMFPKYTQTDETAGSNDAAKEEEKGRRKKTEQKTEGFKYSSLISRQIWISKSWRISQGFHFDLKHKIGICRGDQR